MSEVFPDFMHDLVTRRGSVMGLGRPEPCEGCGQRVMSARCGDGTRLLLSMRHGNLGAVEGWRPIDEHTPERCRTLRGETP